MKELLTNEILIGKVGQFYKTLSEPTRIRILILLSCGERNVGNIAEELGMEQSTVSHQLKLLKLNHLIRSRREGKTIFYQLDDDHVLDILSQTVAHIKHTEHL